MVLRLKSCFCCDLRSILLAGCFAVFLCHSGTAATVIPAQHKIADETVLYRSSDPLRLYAYSPAIAVLPGGRLIAVFDLGGPEVSQRRKDDPAFRQMITPSSGRNRDSLNDSLLEDGFKLVSIAEFNLFTHGNPEANLCSVYQKDLVQGDRFTLGKWGIVVLPR